MRPLRHRPARSRPATARSCWSKPRRAPTRPTGSPAAIDALAGVADVAVAADDRAARDLWRYREGHTEAINLLGAPHKLDVTLPADELAGFVTEVRAVVAAIAPERRGLAVRSRSRRQYSRERYGCCS